MKGWVCIFAAKFPLISQNALEYTKCSCEFYFIIADWSFLWFANTIYNAKIQFA